MNIGIDLGGTRIKTGLLLEDKIVANSIVDVTDSGSLASELPGIEKSIEQMLKGCEMGKGINGVGIALPCLVNSDNNQILSDYVKYRDAADLDITGWVNRNWGAGLIIENDAKAALTGEMQFGACRGSSNAVLLTIGTGIGSAVIMNGDLLKSRNHLAGNLGGHMCIDYSGDICNCGSTGCAETIASTWALPARISSLHRKESSYKRETMKFNDFRSLFKAAAKGDKLALKIEKDCLSAWSAVLINMIYAYDPEIIVLSGGVLGSAGRIIPYLKNEIDKCTWLKKNNIQLVVAQHPDWAGVMGAAWLSKINRNYVKKQL